jgi:hypothetical protein
MTAPIEAEEVKEGKEEPRPITPITKEVSGVSEA